ncbi:MAG: hypothetical protein ACRED3_07400 [Bradyrhizobium sp.]
MLSFKTWLNVGLAVILVWIFGCRLTEWLLTGQLYVTYSLRPAHYVTFTSDPGEFVSTFMFLVVMVGLGLMAIFSAIFED